MCVSIVWSKKNQHPREKKTKSITNTRIRMGRIRSKMRAHCGRLISFTKDNATSAEIFMGEPRVWRFEHTNSRTTAQDPFIMSSWWLCIHWAMPFKWKEFVFATLRSSEPSVVMYKRIRFVSLSAPCQDLFVIYLNHFVPFYNGLTRRARTSCSPISI